MNESVEQITSKYIKENILLSINDAHFRRSVEQGLTHELSAISNISEIAVMCNDINNPVEVIEKAGLIIDLRYRDNDQKMIENIRVWIDINGIKFDYAA